VLSARSEQALANQAKRLLAHVSGNGDLVPVDVGVVPGDDAGGLRPSGRSGRRGPGPFWVEGLIELAAGEPGAGVWSPGVVRLGGVKRCSSFPVRAPSGWGWASSSTAVSRSSRRAFGRGRSGVGSAVCGCHYGR